MNDKRLPINEWISKGIDVANRLTGLALFYGFFISLAGILPFMLAMGIAGAAVAFVLGISGPELMALVEPTPSNAFYTSNLFKAVMIGLSPMLVSWFALGYSTVYHRKSSRKHGQPAVIAKRLVRASTIAFCLCFALGASVFTAYVFAGFL